MGAKKTAEEQQAAAEDMTNSILSQVLSQTARVRRASLKISFPKCTEIKITSAWIS